MVWASNYRPLKDKAQQHKRYRFSSIRLYFKFQDLFSQFIPIYPLNLIVFFTILVICLNAFWWDWFNVISCLIGGVFYVLLSYLTDLLS